MTKQARPRNTGVGTKRKLQQAMEYLIAHPRATTAEVKSAVDCSTRTVTNARAKGYDMGVISRSPYDRAHRDPLAPTEIVDTEGVDELMDEIGKYTGSSGEPLDLDESKSVLAGIARNNSNPDALRIQAITASHRLDQISGAARRLGPPDPLTRAEWVDRTQILLEVAGREIVVEALFAAFDLDEMRGLPSAINIHLSNMAQNAQNDDTSDESVVETPEPPPFSAEGGLAGAQNPEN